MHYMKFFVTGVLFGANNAVADTSDSHALLQRSIRDVSVKAAAAKTSIKAAEKIEKDARDTLAYTPSTKSSCALAVDVCDNVNSLLGQCWESYQGNEVCSKAICNPNGESLKLTCIEYLGAQFGCVSGRNAREVYEAEGLEAAISQALCDSFINMCYEWAPVFVLARMDGQDVDCSEFSSSTAHLWNGACSSVSELLQETTVEGTSESRRAWIAKRSEGNVDNLKDWIRKNAAKQGITQDLSIVNAGTIYTYDFEVMSATQRCREDANMGVVRDRRVSANDLQECKDTCRGDTTCAGVNYSPTNGCELFSSFCKTKVQSSYEGEGEAHRILRTPFLLTCSAGYELETEETPTPIGFCPGSIFDNACVIPLDIADSVCNDMAGCEGYMAPMEPGAIEEAHLDNLAVLTKFETEGDPSFSANWRSCKKITGAALTNGLCCMWPKTATRFDDCVSPMQPTDVRGQSRESCEKCGNFVWLTEAKAEASSCTNSWGNCKHTKCCKDSDFECVRQGLGFAQCRRKGVQMPSGFDGTIVNSDQTFCDSFPEQECKHDTKRIDGSELQLCPNNECDQTTCCVEDYCAKSGEDCSDGGCCRDPKDTCFLDIATGSAECKSTSEGCGALTCNIAVPNLHRDDFKGCTANWEECSATSCCESPQFECYEESSTVGRCRPRGNGPSLVRWEAHGNSTLQQMGSVSKRHSQASLLQQKLLDRSQDATSLDTMDQLLETSTMGKAMCTSKGCMTED